ncbi:MarR family transcriptional regulator [Nocardioides sp. GY 10127]|uniref:MarR family winged helix-turn-helix transcriptional regulator n=1 Tax=Nocardioides sp. GY 10127 TaxID=2569762 RepID=UPI001457FB86|nr:MarR family transcriptional regulator [Nocardioides sp. GY 10127]
MAEVDPTRTAAAARLTETLGGIWGYATATSRAVGGLPTLPPSQARALGLVIASEDGMTPSALAEALDLSRPMVSELVHKLQKTGLVDRRRAEGDGRSVVVFATEHGRYVSRSFRLGIVDSFREAFDRMDAADVAVVLESLPVLADLHDHLRTIADRAEHPDRPDEADADAVHAHGPADAEGKQGAAAGVIGA